ncbi:unnamed protein product [Sphagnum jensenii]|uniref:FAD-binding PCMH-type domain-containing protein n=1 Tax=Sphagnum jensenii TaxID=128206 RepID=A0ABP0VGG2_9BRYO
MKLQIEAPTTLVDINHLGLDKIEEMPDGGVRIGAMVRNSDLAADLHIRKNYPLLARALLAGASAQLRNKATTGGNLLQRTRCYYFYDTTKPCNKREPGSGCAALEGFNRIHAILGTSDQCIAVYPSDMAVAMRALDAKVEVADAQGKRTIALADFHTLPGTTPQIENTLNKGEIITGVTLPKAPKGKQIYRKAYDASDVKLDATYKTPDQCHAMMEPHATLALWQDGKIVVYTSNQIPSKTQEALAQTLKMDKENVRIISRYVGGGFGGKLWLSGDAVLAALAAHQLKRPVKVALTRQQIFHVTTHRPATIQRIRLGATQEGKLTAIAHEVWCGDLPDNEFYESAADQTRSLYAAADRLTNHKLATLDLPKADSMRAPGEAVGLLAIEQAMDELAEKLNIDPIDLRVLNEPTEDPEKKVPFSTRNLVGCMREGAKLFGWEKRNPIPKQVRDGNWLVGIGMASAIRGNILSPAKCHVRLILWYFDRTNGFNDIGTGSYTILHK